MKTYLVRIKEKRVNGKIIYQPQLKKKILLFFLFNWQPLCMLIIYADENPQRSEIKWWTENKKEAELELDKFAFNHKEVKLEQHL